ncbi:MAG TPA: hypothetical protein VE085_14815 [Burkholderiales bacterium]|nr:hypothetical protein [Burkholderiales bacterium]
MADEKNLKTVATVAYALQAAGFFVGITWIVAVIVDYVKKDDARGTWLESHYRWQIRTFWFELLWGAIGGILCLIPDRLRHPRRRRHLDHLPHRQGLAQPRGGEAHVRRATARRYARLKRSSSA